MCRTRAGVARTLDISLLGRFATNHPEAATAPDLLLPNQFPRVKTAMTELALDLG